MGVNLLHRGDNLEPDLTSRRTVRILLALLSAILLLAGCGGYSASDQATIDGLRQAKHELDQEYWSNATFISDLADAVKRQDTQALVEANAKWTKAMKAYHNKTAKAFAELPSGEDERVQKARDAVGQYGVEVSKTFANVNRFFKVFDGPRALSKRSEKSALAQFEKTNAAQTASKLALDDL